MTSTSNSLYRASQVEALGRITDWSALGRAADLPELVWTVGLTGATGTPADGDLATLQQWVDLLGLTLRPAEHAQNRWVTDEIRNGVFLWVETTGGQS